MSAVLIPTEDQLKAGIRAFYEREKRSQAYFEALSIIYDNWGKADDMAKGIKILLDSWHINFYRFGKFNLRALSDCIAKHFDELEIYKNRNIVSLAEPDKDLISLTFRDFLDALKGGKDGDYRSPVAGAKAIHLLAPHFFPLWDNYIALGYNALWGSAYSGIFQYITFTEKMREIVMAVSDYQSISHPVPIRSALKILDEYNYAKFTKRWI